jgi:DNA-binding CsgD family transcriptional regulator
VGPGGVGKTRLALRSAASSEGVRLSREAGDLYQLEAMLRNVGLAALMAGDLEASKPWLVEAMRVAQQVDNRFAQFYLLTSLGWHAASSGQARLAAQLLGAAESLGTGAGARISGPHAPLLARAKESARGTLGAPSCEAAFEAGRRLRREAAVRLALGEPDQVEPEAGGEVTFGPLAKREVEVAQLVAEGLSNKQIAARLLISEPTVATHMRSIMNKLGCNARAQIASWMAASKR